VDYCRELTDAALDALADCRLLSLDVSSCKFSDEAMLRLFQTCTGLRSLSLAHCKQLRDGTIASLAQITTLEVLDLSHCKQEDSGLSTLARGCIRLKEVNIKHCRKVKTCDAIKALLQGCPNLSLVRMHNCGYDNAKETAALQRHYPDVRLDRFPH